MAAITFRREAARERDVPSMSNRHINPTNVCRGACIDCVRLAEIRALRRYTFALEEIFPARGTGRARRGHGIPHRRCLHPDLSFDYFLGLIRGLKERFGACI